MLLEPSGPCRIKNVKHDVYVGRSPVEDKSLLPKSFVPLNPDELGLNSVFKYDTGINNNLYEFHILGAGVAKSDKLPSGKPALRPVAVLQHYISAFNWEINPQGETTPYVDGLLDQLEEHSELMLSLFAGLKIWRRARFGRSLMGQTSLGSITFVVFA